MGEKFKKWVEESTEGQYVPLGSKCDLCGRKLVFFATGFWSCNTKHLYDGKLCSKCAKKNRSLSERNASVDAPGAAEKVEALRGL